MKKTENNDSLLLFASAFSLGALFTYFASSCGQKKKQELAAKWEEAKEYLWQEGLIKNKDLSFEDFRRDYLQKLGASFKQMKADFENKNLEKEIAHLAKLKRRRSRSKKAKFKGV